VRVLTRLWRPAARRSRLTVAEALRRAEQRRREGRYAEAGALVAAALDLDHDNLHAHLLAAYLYVARRETTFAKTEFRCVLRHDPTHPRALLGLAGVALEENDVRACRELLDRALRFYPDFPEAAALLAAVRAGEEAAAGATRSPAPRGARLRLPGTGRALIVSRIDGGLIAAQPPTRDAGEVAAAIARMLQLAGGVVDRAGLGRLHRAIVDDGRDAVFTRTDSQLVVSLALPRSTDPPQGLLDLNRLWSAALHELGLATAAPIPVPRIIPANTPAAVRTRRVS
jgi:tetratricopeptide (TPR) repeat protein